MTPTISRDPPNTEGQGQLCANLNNERQATRTQFHLYADDGQTNIHVRTVRLRLRTYMYSSDLLKTKDASEEEREKEDRNGKIDAEKKRSDGRSEADLYEFVKNLEMKLHRPQLVMLACS